MTSLERSDMDGLTIFRFNGSLNSEGLEQVETPFEAAVHQPGLRAVVDLSNVNMVTTPALSMFIAASQSAKESGGRLVFAHAVPHVRQVVERLRLQRVLHTVEGLDEAMQAARQ